MEWIIDGVLVYVDDLDRHSARAKAGARRSSLTSRTDRLGDDTGPKISKAIAGFREERRMKSALLNQPLQRTSGCGTSERFETIRTCSRLSGER
jgi:hypothetical protein